MENAKPMKVRVPFKEQFLNRRQFTNLYSLTKKDAFGFSNAHFAISEPKIDRALLPDHPKTSGIDDKTVPPAEPPSWLLENLLVAPTLGYWLRDTSTLVLL